MNEVMEVLFNLMAMEQAGVDPTSEEGQMLFPPKEIANEIANSLPDTEPTPLLKSWIAEQQRIQQAAEQLAAELPPFIEGNNELPGWMGKKWAIQLAFPWGAGLADAVREGKAWLASQ